MKNKLTKSKVNEGNIKKKITEIKPKLGKSKKKLTKEEIKAYQNEIKFQDEWVKKNVENLKKSNTWSQMYYTTWEGYIKLLEYEDINTKKHNEHLPHVAIYKLQSETIQRIKESFRQIEIINSQLHKKPKQELLDSEELKNMLLNLAHYQSLGGQFVSIDRNNFGSLLFSIGLKILLESVQPELRERLLSFVKEFNDLNGMVQRLTGKQMASVKLDYDKSRQVVDINFN